jgi:hypothetical protein
MIGHISQSALIRNLTVVGEQHYRTQNNPQNTEYASCLVNVSPVAGLTTGESVVTPNSREFHVLPGGLFVA